MKKVIDIICKVLLSLLLIMPILGVTGIFPAPTADMYGTPEAFAFIKLLMDSKYIMFIEAIVFAAVVVCLWIRREALAALLLLPFTVNIVGFHAFLDSGLFTPGAIMADLLLVLNIYFLWRNWDKYKPLFNK
ncbi:MAG: hypothetical protein ACK4NC_00400 [Candidatus Gracilibacteria bacterium]